MILVGMMPTRNSGWIIGASLRSALRWCDAVVVLLHACTDDTADIVEAIQHEYIGRVHVLVVLKNDWDDADNRQLCLEAARRVFSVTHIATVDDDEILTYSPSGIRRAVEELAPQVKLAVPWLQVWDGGWKLGIANAVTLAFRDEPGVAFRPLAGNYQYHPRSPHGLQGLTVLDWAGGLLHYQFASRRRLLAKHAFYKMTEHLRWPGRLQLKALNRMYDRTALPVPVDVPLAPIPDAWWQGQEELRDLIHVDEEPWQEVEAKRLWALHGPVAFQGLDLYGVVG